MRVLLATAVPLLVTASGVPTARDLQRAAQPRPRASLTAKQGEAVSHVLNQQLLTDPTLRTRHCEKWSMTELNTAARTLLRHRSPRLQEVYAERGDRRALRGDEGKIEEQWALEDDHPAVRDVRCAEVVMLFVHHLSKPARDSLAPTIVLPLLPLQPAVHPDPAKHALLSTSLAGGASCQSGHAGMEDDTCTRAVWDNCADGDCSSFDACISRSNGSSSVVKSCSGYDGLWKACSQAPKGTQNNGPHHDGAKPWPAEVVWEGHGYGVYPFWSHLATPKTDIVNGHAIKTHWSSTKNAELFEHAKCQMDLVGYSGGDVACKHLFIGEYAWFYTATEDWCCLSGDKQSRQGFGPLTAPQRNWTQALQYVGTSHLKTLFYDGQIKNYTLGFTSGPPFQFWYYTDMEDRPIEQGEGCQIMPRTGNCNGPTYLWHDYNPAKFNATTLDWSVFAIPKVCQGTTNYCLFP